MLSRQQQSSHQIRRQVPVNPAGLHQVFITEWFLHLKMGPQHVVVVVVVVVVLGVHVVITFSSKVPNLFRFSTNRN